MSKDGELSFLCFMNGYLNEFTTMRFLVFPFMLLILASDTYAQSRSSVNVSELIEIINKSDFKKMTDLVHKLSYVVIDSTKLDNGSLSYITREAKLMGNMLGCNVKKDKRIALLNFHTYDSLLSGNIKKQLIDFGFKTKGKNKFNIEGYSETQDYVKEKIEVGFGIKRRNDKWIEYDFNFLKL